MSGFWAAVGALAPPVGVGLVFWLVMRWIVQADRRERAAQARLDAEQRRHGDAAQVQPDAGAAGPERPDPPVS
jgi:hypothetical protein